MRVGVIGLLQESNTFLPDRTTWEHFEADILARGEDVRDRFVDALHEIGGFFAGLSAADIEAVPLFAARALPYGVIEKKSFKRLVDELLDELRTAGSLDGLLLAPHGATVSEAYPDADGYWLKKVRQAVGPDVPIIATIDPHANLSMQMVQACNALIAYRSNPHMDQRDRGVEAAQLIDRVLHKQVQPTMVAQFPPLAMSIESQCTEEQPCSDLVEIANQVRAEPGVLSASIVLGFPYADVPEMGSAVIVVTDNDVSLAAKLSRHLADEIWSRRDALVRPLPGVAEAVGQSLQSPTPVCLLDTGDNVGGGSPGDGTWLAHALLQKQVDRALVCINDPQAVAKAVELGAGGEAEFEIGGVYDLSGKPLTGRYRIRSIHAGTFEEQEPRHGGISKFDQGPTAVLSQNGLTVLVTSRRMVPFSLSQLTSCNLDPTSYRILVAKGVNAPIAAYQQVCNSFLRVGTPGVTAADMTSLDFSQRRVPLYPFELDGPFASGFGDD